MGILRYLFLFFVIYMAIRFIAGFVLPLFRITRVANDKMKQMRDQMEQMQQQHTESASGKQQTKRSVKEEYIDFEEIK